MDSGLRSFRWDKMIDWGQKEKPTPKKEEFKRWGALERQPTVQQGLLWKGRELWVPTIAKIVFSLWQQRFWWLLFSICLLFEMRMLIGWQAGKQVREKKEGSEETQQAHNASGPVWNGCGPWRFPTQLASYLAFFYHYNQNTALEFMLDTCEQ